MLDNLANLTMMIGLLAANFGFPAAFAVRHMVPGTAIGVVIGDVLFTWMAFRLARRTGRPDVTAMPLGIDTPSLFGMVFFVLGPAFLDARKADMPVDASAMHVWHIGICSIVVSGVFKLVCSAGSGWIRRHVPRAGLLGSLTAVALVLISFLPLLEILHYPVAGMVALAVVLTTLVARVELPGRIPGALAGLLIGAAIFYLMKATGTLGPVPASNFIPRDALWPTEWLGAFSFQWLAAWTDAVRYLPIVIPLALATVIGGIDCTESAAAAGDEYRTGPIIAVEAVATLVAGLCGGVIQTTPYIGHPAYKAMGGRAAYTLAAAAFIGGAGLAGFFGYLYDIIPQPAILPILIFIGLEITSQSFHATPVRHYTAVALACVPAMALLVMSQIDGVLNDAAVRGAKLTADSLRPELAAKLETMRILSNGFILTSLLWGSALAALIDRRLAKAAAFFVVAGLCAAFGIIHSPFADGRLFTPWNIPDLTAPMQGQTPLHIACGYFAAAALLGVWSLYVRTRNEEGK